MITYDYTRRGGPSKLSYLYTGRNGESPKDYRKIVILFHKYEYFTEALIYSTIILSLMDVY